MGLRSRVVKLQQPQRPGIAQRPLCSNYVCSPDQSAKPHFVTRLCCCSVEFFIYDLLLASNRMVLFSVKKFVERNFSPLTEKILAGKKITVAIDLRANNS